MHDFACRPGCGACCIALSISSPIPGLPRGKPSGEPCSQLLPDMRCGIFGQASRPACCSGLKPCEEMCGDTPSDALNYLYWLEKATSPEAPHGS